MQSTEWYIIPGTDGLYEITKAGVVRRCGLRPDGTHHKPRAIVTVAGYPQIALHLPGRVWQVRLHRLLLLTFVGPEPFPGAVGRHLDDDPWNYSLENLAWGTRAQNIEDARRNGGAEGWGYLGKRTHCKNGHEYTPANTRMAERDGYEVRICRACRNEESARRRERRAEAGS